MRKLYDSDLSRNWNDEDYNLILQNLPQFYNIYIRNKYIIIYHCDLRLDAYCIGNHYLVFNANLTNIKNRILSNYCTVLPFDEYVYGLINHYLVNMICNAQHIIIKILYQLPLFAIFFRGVITEKYHNKIQLQSKQDKFQNVRN